MIPARKTLNASKQTAKTIDLNITTGGTVTLRAAGSSDVRVFDLVAYTGGFVDLPVYDIPVVFDLATMQKQPNLSQVPLLKDHDSSKGVGHSDDVVIDATSGVSGTGYMSVPGSFRDQIVEAADNGKEWQLSVGGTAGEGDIRFIEEGEKFTINNRGLQGPALLVSNYLLREISFVEAGADQTGAVAKLAAAYTAQIPKGESMTFEEWLSSLGIKIDALTAEGATKMRKQFEADQKLSDDDDAEESDDDDTETDDVGAAEEARDKAVADSAGTTEADKAVAESVRQTTGETMAAEVERKEELETLNAQFGNPKHNVNGKQVSLLATALRSGWDADKFELHARREARPQRMSPTRNEGGNSQSRVSMLAAMTFAIMSHASADVERDFRGNGSAREYLNASLLADPKSDSRDKAMNAAHDFRHHSLVDLVAAAMSLDEIDCTAPKRSDKWFEAAFSSNSVQDLFTQSTQAILLDSYMQNAATYANFASIVDQVDVPNFKANERKTVSPDSGELEKLLPTETAGDAILTAGGEEYKIARFAKRWGIDDQDMINEEFGVFRTMPQFLGMSAARLFGQAIAKLLLTNPNLKDGNAWLSSGAGNLRTSSALTAANVKAALTQFGTRTDGNVSLELDPNVLFTPKALRFTAAEVFNDAPLVTGENQTQTSRNVLAGIIDSIVHSALLDNGFNDPDERSTAIAGDATSWWLFDNRYRAIEVGHLQGSGRGPTIRTGTYSDGKYGVWFDVKRDLGAAPLRRESVQKNEA